MPTPTVDQAILWAVKLTEIQDTLTITEVIAQSRSVDESITVTEGITFGYEPSLSAEGVTLSEEVVTETVVTSRVWDVTLEAARGAIISEGVTLVESMSIEFPFGETLTVEEEVVLERLYTYWVYNNETTLLDDTLSIQIDGSFSVVVNLDEEQALSEGVVISRETGISEGFEVGEVALAEAELNLALPELVTLSESVDTNIRPVSEAVTPSESVYVWTDPLIPESVSLTELISAYPESVSNAESVTVAESITLSVEIAPLSESLALTEIVGVYRPVLEESVSLTETVTDNVAQPSETLTLTEAITNNVVQLSETATTLAETVTYNVDRLATIGETAALSEQVTRTLTEEIGESLTPSDSAVDTPVERLTTIGESQGLSESLNTWTNPLIPESVSISGGVSKLYNYLATVEEVITLTEETDENLRGVGESLGVSEQVTTTRLIARLAVIGESLLFIEDVTIPEITRTIDESLTPTESLTLDIEYNLSETLTATEALSLSPSREFSEGLTLSEVVDVEFDLSEGLTLGESVIFEAEINLPEALVPAESMILDIDYNLPEIVTVTEQVIFEAIINISDGITPTESVIQQSRFSVKDRRRSGRAWWTRRM